MTDQTTMTRNRKIVARLAAVAACALATLVLPATASAAVEWRTETIWAPSPIQEGEAASAYIAVYNQGDTDASGIQQVTVQLPAGITYNGKSMMEGGWVLCEGEGTSTATCLGVEGAPAFGKAGTIAIGFDVEPGLSGSLPFSITTSGGGAAEPFVESGNLIVDDERYGFGLTPGSVFAGAVDQAGNDFTTAGGHPFKVVGDFDVNLGPNSMAGLSPTHPGFPASDGGIPKDIITELPPGFVGNPTAVARCSYADFPNDCPPESQIGLVRTRWLTPGFPDVTGLYNMVPPGEQPAQFAFHILGMNIAANPFVGADGNYAIRLKTTDLPEAVQPLRISVQVWGVPADPSHDIQRCDKPSIAVNMTCSGRSEAGGPPTPPTPGSGVHPQASSAPPIPFLSNPTNCSDPQLTKFHMTLWTNSAPNEDFSDPRWRNFDVSSPDLVGCEDLPFEPTLDFETSTAQADSPTGLSAHLHIPQDGLEDRNKLATAHLKQATVTLPEGVAFNASAANGLEACSSEQIGLVTAPGESPHRFNNVEPSCPPASKIANALVSTPLLEDDLAGEVFLAAQDDNPFGSTFAIYIVVREPSILVKLPGLIELDERTGQVTASFDQNPQLPFSDLKLDFFDGPRASLATPQTCGAFTVRSELAPWSAQDPDNPLPSEIVSGSDDLAVSSMPGGHGCVGEKSQLPFGLSMHAGAVNPIAGAHSSFDVRIARPDGAQELDSLSLTMPEGFTGSLKGIPYCSEAQIAAAATRTGREEQASSSCPAASQIATTQVGAGAGSNPFHVSGKVFLSGPYKGASLSLAVIVPAVAGPFDLGVQVVRVALQVDPRTARITAVTDPLPRKLEGIPLRLRDIRVAIDRPGFALNPTDCSEQRVAARVNGADGGAADLSSRFQVGGCRELGFKPGLSLRLDGGTGRAAHPALTAVVTPRPGDANISRAAVTLPRSAFLDQGHIRTICTRVQFAADACPEGAIYGRAVATTPLLDEPVSGPVYLRSSDNKLPDLVVDLHGQVDVELVGRIDSIRGGIRNTFDIIPDVPVTKFTLEMQGGKKGLITNSRNLCAKVSRADAKLVGQNGRRYNFRPKVVATSCKKKRKASRRSHKR